MFAFPLWNFTIPAKLQTFVDYVAAAGFSFKYSAEGQLIQLMTDKKVVAMYALRIPNEEKRIGVGAKLKIYECEDCSNCPFKPDCTKAKGNRQMHWNTI